MRKKKVPKVPVSVRLKPNTKARAVEFAKNDRRTLSNVIQMAVAEFLARRSS